MSLFGGAFQIIAKYELQFPFALPSASTRSQELIPDPASALIQSKSRVCHGVGFWIYFCP
jgi:hypothetical protein